MDENRWGERPGYVIEGLCLYQDRGGAAVARTVKGR
jgi:hypothetical protein